MKSSEKIAQTNVAETNNWKL